MKLISLLPLILLTACVVEHEPFKEGKILGGKKVDADTLNLGYTTYVEYCIQCHGMKGEGNGPSSKGLLPPPRNFTQGLYKFPYVPYGELPHDEDFARIIRGGLKGTAMLPWDISDERLNAVIQYIKTFAPQAWEGADKVPGTKLEIAADPWGEAKKAQAIERGKRVYHVTANCIQCHRAYETKANIMSYAKEAKADVSLDNTLYQLKVQDGEYNYKVLPPDYSYHQLRTINSVNDIVQRAAYGVTGSGMPGFKDVVPDEDLWAVAYYVDSIRQLGKDTKARQALMEKLNAQK
ncbi:MAG: c-type cytochrome [Bacteriovoracaceae bacterium]